MLQRLNIKTPINQVFIIGILFFMAGLSAFVVIRELTPLFILGVLFLVTPMLTGDIEKTGNAI